MACDFKQGEHRFGNLRADQTGPQDHQRGNSGKLKSFSAFHRGRALMKVSENTVFFIKESGRPPCAGPRKRQTMTQNRIKDYLKRNNLIPTAIRLYEGGEKRDELKNRKDKESERLDLKAQDTTGRGWGQIRNSR